ncbi:hypothetical protein E4U50_000536, partial [Claviceps purpurea]
MTTQQTQTSTLMTHGICKLENPFNSYYSTAILQSGSYSSKTAISTSKTNSIATIRQLSYNPAATLRKLPFHFENQFNSYYSTAILQSGGYSTKTVITISKTNSIAT